MAGLGPAIHDLNSTSDEVVDARTKAGHDAVGQRFELHAEVRAPMVDILPPVR